MDAVTVGWLLTSSGLCLTALGWVVGNVQANARETRKEYRSALTGMEITLDRLLAAYRCYLIENDEAKSEQSRLQVHSEMNRLRRQIEWLEPVTEGTLMKYYASLYEAITGGDFESKTRSADKSSNNYRSAVTAVESLLEGGESWFRNKYHGKK